jgi:hypothetical protein
MSDPLTKILSTERGQTRGKRRTWHPGNRKGCDIGYAPATNSCEGANSVDACTVAALDAITADVRSRTRDRNGKCKRPDGTATTAWKWMRPDLHRSCSVGSAVATAERVDLRAGRGSQQERGTARTAKKAFDEGTKGSWARSGWNRRPVHATEFTNLSCGRSCQTRSSSSEKRPLRRHV